MVSHCPSNKKSKSLNKPAMCCMICPSLLANLHQLLCFCSCFFSYFWPLVLPFPMPFPIYIVYQVLCLECLAFFLLFPRATSLHLSDSSQTDDAFRLQLLFLDVAWVPAAFLGEHSSFPLWQCGSDLCPCFRRLPVPVCG